MNTPKDQISPSTMTAVNLGGGIIAGTAAAIISQPADTLLSKINKQKGVEGQSVTSRLLTMAGQLGAKGLFVGLGESNFFHHMGTQVKLTTILKAPVSSWLLLSLPANSPFTATSSASWAQPRVSTSPIPNRVLKIVEVNLNNLDLAFQRNFTLDFMCYGSPSRLRLCLQLMIH